MCPNADLCLIGQEWCDEKTLFCWLSFSSLENEVKMGDSVCSGSVCSGELPVLKSGECGAKGTTKS